MVRCLKAVPSGHVDEAIIRDGVLLGEIGFDLGGLGAVVAGVGFRIRHSPDLRDRAASVVVGVFIHRLDREQCPRKNARNTIIRYCVPRIPRKHIIKYWRLGRSFNRVLVDRVIRLYTRCARPIGLGENFFQISLSSVSSRPFLQALNAVSNHTNYCWIGSNA